MTESKTTLDKAKEAYEKILKIQPSYGEFSSFPPSNEDEIKEHDRVYRERVAVIERLLK